MKTHQFNQPISDRWSLFMTCCIFVIRAVAPSIFTHWIEIPLVGFFILLMGSPHGAIDHLVYYKVLGLSRAKHHPTGSSISALDKRMTTDVKTSDLMKRRFDHLLFYGNYLGFMILWGLAWFVIPSVTLAAFLLVSSYHFGETDVDDLVKCIQSNSKSSSPLIHIVPSILVASRGIFIVGLIMTSSPEMAFGIMSHMTSFSFEAFSIYCKYGYVFFILQNYLILTATMLGLGIPSVSTRGGITIVTAISYELFKSSLFWCVFYVFGSCTGFSIFFGCWHSVTSISQDIELLSSIPDSSHQDQEQAQSPIPALRSTFDFYAHAIPFSLTALSLLGLMTFCYVGPLPLTSFSSPRSAIIHVMKSNPHLISGTESSLWAVFIVFISIVTGPHMWVMFLMHKLNLSNSSTLTKSTENEFSLDAPAKAWTYLDPFGFRFFSFSVDEQYN